MRQGLPLLRGQVWGAHLPGTKLADGTYAKTGKYKYFVLLQGDDQFRYHPFRAVALINTEEPSHITTASQYPVKDLRSQSYGASETITRGFVDLTYIVMLEADFIRQGDYIDTLTQEAMRRLDKKLLVGLGVTPPKLNASH